MGPIDVAIVLLVGIVGVCVIALLFLEWDED